MKVTILPSPINGIIQAPASKSSMQRACAAALLTAGPCFIQHPGHSNDDNAALDIIQKLGAQVEAVNNRLKIESRGVYPTTQEINCGESGLSIRMFTPIVALSNQEILIKGSGSLTKRPMDFFDVILPHLGVKVRSNSGKLPISVQGPLVPASIEIEGSLSSQFLTGLLMAYSAAGAAHVAIKVNHLKSKPYIDLTLDVMQKFGMHLPENRNYETFYFNAPDRHSQSVIQYTVEGDWSGAAFLLVAGAIAGPVTVTGLDLSSTQADKQILHALTQANADFEINEEKIRIQPGNLTGFQLDATDCPDLFPPLTALAAYCKGITQISGVKRLIHKESNRAAALQQEFKKMGVRIETNEDTMYIYGGVQVKGAQVHSHHDHRIAMACAIASLGANSTTVIENAEAVNKSYPDFYSDLKNLGAQVSLTDNAITVT